MKSQIRDWAPGARAGAFSTTTKKSSKYYELSFRALIKPHPTFLVNFATEVLLNMKYTVQQIQGNLFSPLFIYEKTKKVRGCKPHLLTKKMHHKRVLKKRVLQNSAYHSIPDKYPPCKGSKIDFQKHDFSTFFKNMLLRLIFQIAQ